MNKYEKFQDDYGRLQQQDDKRPKNYDDWCSAAKAQWQAKPIEEAESYYINLKGFVSKLKHNPRNGVKPRALIHKKKMWRNGLHAILCNDPTVGKHYRKAELPKTLPNSKPPPSKTPEQMELEKQRIRQQKATQDEDDLTCDEELE